MRLPRACLRFQCNGNFPSFSSIPSKSHKRIAEELSNRTCFKWLLLYIYFIIISLFFFSLSMGHSYVPYDTSVSVTKVFICCCGGGGGWLLTVTLLHCCLMWSMINDCNGNLKINRKFLRYVYTEEIVSHSRLECMIEKCATSSSRKWTKKKITHWIKENRNKNQQISMMLDEIATIQMIDN